MWKNNIVVPIPKTPGASTLNSLRPISQPPFLSKLLEKLCYAQFSQFISSVHALPDLQSGFRRGYSTTTALLFITDSILRAMDSRNIALITSLDFSKAFDTVDHNLLIAKLKFFGLSPLSLSWFRSYLIGRTQQVMINRDGPKFSSSRAVRCGVPQGSVLGPLLFNIFVADILRLTTTNISCMYADDMQIISTFSPNNINEAVNNLEFDLAKISDWAVRHGLRLNPSKSSILVLGSSFLLRALPPITVTIDSIQLHPATSLRNLGITLDSTLTFENHVSTVCRQAYNRLRLLYPSRHILSTTQKLLLSQSLVISLFDYCDVLYSPFLTSRLTSLIQRVQNSCLRFSYCVRKFDHISPLFVKSSWLRMSQRWKLHLCCLVFKILTSSCPTYLYNILRTNLSFHSSKLFSVAHINIRSLVAHFTDIIDLLSSLNFDVLTVSETWLSDAIPSSSLTIPGYTFFRSDSDYYYMSLFHHYN